MTLPFKFHSEICRLECYRGYCQNQKCICNPGWGGALCDQLSCDPWCDDFKGKCENGTCVCRKGWNGKHCTIGMAPLTYVCVSQLVFCCLFIHIWFFFHDPLIFVYTLFKVYLLLIFIVSEFNLIWAYSETCLNKPSIDRKPV